ncbi:MAG: hypothetical protein Q7U04_15165 [Bacteriovorax sp.]|nr:hypothetical protein [Bacteriovorax sp.]
MNQFTTQFITTKRSLILSVSLLSICLSLNSCVQGAGTARKLTSKSGLTSSTDTGGSSGTGSGAVGTDTSTPNTSNFTQRVELSHLVDPFDGTYKKKLTIPKNFKGNLYLAGLNVASLTSKLVSVRFNFGADKQPIVLTATVARAPGIIPATDIQVLVIDMNSRPFNRMRLGYDLYDYNDYTDATKDIVSDPRDGGLYCRGLKLEDDPTFTALNNTSTCSGTSDKCLYSYAKVTDSTLYSDQIINLTSYRLSAVPTRSQVWSEATGVRNPTVASLATNACLPDDIGATSLNQLFDINVGSLGYDLAMFGAFYRGPYRSINDSEWQVSGDAIYNSTNGLFQVRPLISSMITGYHSLLFPRAGKMQLNQNVSYLGSTDRVGARAKMMTDSSGVSSYVDGCNIRVSNFDPSSNEGIGSCNVNASIEVFYMVDGKETSITIDKSIKLQLIRASVSNSDGKEVLTTAFKRCESSTTCGSDECCFNSRCWSKDLVTQCVDQTQVVGNQGIGANCASDFECSSLCCNQSTGACSPHNPNGVNPVSCNKSAGQQCVSKEFCQQTAVSTCRIVKTGFKPDGTVSCDRRCAPVMTYGDCKSGACVPAVAPAIPTFDPVTCAGAVDP